jgi:hypothetical protein
MQDGRGECGVQSLLTLTTLGSGHQRLNTHDVHDADEVLGQYVQRHLDGDFRKTPYHELCRPHSDHQSGKWDGRGCTVIQGHESHNLGPGAGTNSRILTILANSEVETREMSRYAQFPSVKRAIADISI